MTVERPRTVGQVAERIGLARQVLTLQVVLVLLTVAAAVVAAGLVADRLVTAGAEDRVRSVAAAVAEMSAVADALGTDDPSGTLQPLAERVRQRSGVSFVVVMTVDGTRFSHPDPEQLGDTYIGTIAPAAAGGEVVETYVGTLGPSVRAVLPVRGPGGGEPVGLVSVGVTIDRIGAAVSRGLVVIGVAGAAALLLAVVGSWGIARRLRRQTFGLTPRQLAREHAHHEAVLHAVREGLLVVDEDRRVTLVNDEARRLLGVDEDVEGQPVATLPVDGALLELLASGRQASDELHLACERLVVVNQLPVGSRRPGEDRLGTVLTMRDHTEVTALSDQLGAVRNLTESLRAQAHEADNRLHTVVSLIELGEVDAALQMATAQVGHSQDLVDRLVGQIDEPELVALLLGKASQAHEHGVTLAVADASTTGRSGLDPSDLVTILGNLLDNAFDAVAAAAPPRRVDVAVEQGDGHLAIEVADTGPGFTAEALAHVFEPGWSTKSPTPGRWQGRGLGMALVRRVVNRLDGEMTVANREDAAGAVVRIRLPLAASGADHLQPDEELTP